METVEGLFFTVKGLLHPKDRVVAYLRYVPDARGERKREGRRYRRVYDLGEATEILRRDYPQYLGRVESLGRTLQTVPWDRIARVYKPEERLRSLMDRPRTGLEEIVVEFASGLSSESGVPLDNFGVSGSILIGLTSPSSDVDLIVHGEEPGRSVYEALKRLRAACNWISPYDENTVEKVLRARWGDAGVDLERLRGIEVKKVLHGLVRDRDYFVRLVKGPGEVEAEIASRPLRRAKLKAVVAGAEDSIFTPCRYLLRRCTLQEPPLPRGVTELLSFRGRFTEQAAEGETVEAAGTLEEVEYGDRAVYRVVLGGRGDYLIPIRG